MDLHRLPPIPHRLPPMGPLPPAPLPPSDQGPVPEPYPDYPGAVPQEVTHPSYQETLQPYPVNGMGQWQQQRRKSSLGSSGIFGLEDEGREGKLCKRCCCCFGGLCVGTMFSQWIPSIMCCLCNSVQQWLNNPTIGPLNPAFHRYDGRVASVIEFSVCLFSVFSQSVIFFIFSAKV